MLHVVAGVLVAADGRVLLAQRPPGSHLAGAWEFPGGKVEPGERADVALSRELHEELGVRIGDPMRAFLSVPWYAGERPLRLETWLVEAWDGEPRALEGQALEWARPERVEAAILAPADRPILDALVALYHSAAER